MEKIYTRYRDYTVGFFFTSISTRTNSYTMSDSPPSRTRSVFSLERSKNNNINNNHLSSIFATRRSRTFACTITIFFILSTIFFLFSHLSYNNTSPAFVRYIMQNRSHFSTFFSHLFPTTPPTYANFYPDTKALSTNYFSDPPMKNASSPQISMETNEFFKNYNESDSGFYNEQDFSDLDLNRLVNSSADELERLINCDLFDGYWVKDHQLPMYPPGSCPFIDESFDCFLNRRPDNGYERYRWQPKHCNIPRYATSSIHLRFNVHVSGLIVFF